MAWYKIFASADEAKNRIGNKKIQLVKIKGKLIFITRIGEEFFAADNECPHQGAYMNEGSIGPRGEIICPWHGYRFSLKSGQEISGKKCRPLYVYEVNINAKGFFVKIEI